MTAHLSLPTSLLDLLVDVHGREALGSFAVPDEHTSFAGPRARGEWGIYTWEEALSATEGGYLSFVGPDATDSERRGVAPESRARRHLAARGKRRSEHGRIYDLDDGHPALGLVYDLRWTTFAEYARASSS